MVKASGPASSTARREGAEGWRKNNTVSTTSSRRTTCSLAVPGMEGRRGSAARPRISALAPNTCRPRTTEGRRITQSRSRAISASSPAIFVAEKADGCSRSTPMAEKWITRRTPACSQARKSAEAPPWWTFSVFSRGLSCSTPAQLTTASIPCRCGSQCSGAVARAMSNTTLRGANRMGRRETGITSCPSAPSLAARAEPMRPVAPVSRILIRRCSAPRCRPRRGPAPSTPCRGPPISCSAPVPSRG